MLVGRQAELETLTDLLRGDHPALVLGEPGIGKTALLRAALDAVDMPHRIGGALASLRWLEYVPLARALGARRLEGDPAAVAGRVRTAVADALLALEDLHWADAGTADVIELLAGSVPMIVTARPGDDELPARLERLGFVRLELGPLPDDASDALVRSLRPDASAVSVSRIVRRCGGVPLLLTQLAGPEGEASESLRIALNARLRTVSDAAADLFTVLAVVGRPVALAEGDNDAVEELRRAGLAVLGDDGWAVAHAVLGELARGRLEANDLAAGHGKAASLVADDGERARHLERAGERAQALRLALSAAEAASGPAERAAHLSVAARCASGDDADTLRLDAARGLIVALRPAEALPILDAVEGSAPAMLAERAVLRSRALWLAGDDEGFAAAIDDAVSKGTAAGGAALATALVEQARIPIFLDPEHDPDGPTMARGAVAAARDAGIPTARAEMLLGLAHYMRDEEGWQPALEGALDAARREADVDTEMSAANNLITAHESSGDPEEGRRLAQEMAARAASLKMVGWQLQFRAMLLNLDLHAARYFEVVGEAIELLDEPLDARARAQVTTALVFALIDLGRFEVVDARLAELHADHRTPVSTDTLRWLQAEAALLGGRPRDAHRLAREAIELGMADPFAPLVERWAAFEIDEAVTPLEASDVPMFRGVRAESLGIASLAAARPDEAAAQFAEGAARWEAYHRRGHLRCRWAEGEALRRARDETGARERLLRLEEELDGRGMAPLLARTHRSLRALGVRRSAPRGRTGADRLTAREAEVLQLVGAGLSNADIGRRLSLSRSTVNELVVGARDRLGAASRGEAASILLR